MKTISICLLIIVSVFQFGCSTRQIIRDSEYKQSEAAFQFGDVKEALNRFPRKEKKGFITSLEKAWLGFWEGEGTNADLMKQANTLQQRRFTSVLRETQYFFYSEAEDGYIPAEHEIIIMHMINAMYFLREKKWTEASVETRKATFFVQNYFRDDQPHFDDPALRLWLAGLYAALGEWTEAQVDLRKAYELSGDKSVLRLAELTSPPQHLNIIFEGRGPRVEWKEGIAIPEFSDGGKAPKTEVHYSTLPWFDRHQKRNTAIRNVVMNSNYMAQYYGLQGAVGAEKSAGFVASNTLRVVGITAGVVIIGGGLYLLAQSGSTGSGEAASYIFATGLLAGQTLWEKGDEVSAAFKKSAEESKTRGLEDLKTYRFVRFMPSWISLQTGSLVEMPPAKGVTIVAPKSKTEVQFLQRY